MAEAAPGHYYGFIVSAQTCEPEKADGKPFVRIQFNIPYQAGSDNAGNPQWVELPEPLQRDVLLSLSEKAWQYSEKKLEFLGFNGNFAEPGFESQEGVELECSHQARDGQMRERWDLANWGGGASYKSATQQVLAQLQQRWNQDKKAAQAPAGAPPAPPKPAATRQQSNGGVQPAQSAQPKPVAPAQPAQPPMPDSMANAGDDDDIPF